MKNIKFDFLDIILAYILLPFFTIYWIAVLIWWIQGLVNSKRTQLNELWSKQYGK